ncbi:MAG: sugar ABC transporter permease [Planctomycetaceae bacterium]|nr:sugar ABC transporter permease [Phycisphaerales bacterium]MCE2652279.1 sugar ABC transporter permease [Planctomycetaceae bacterium]
MNWRALRRELTGWLWVSPWLVGASVFMFLPMGMSLWYSLSDYPLIESPIWTGMGNYQRMMDDPVFWRVVRNTALFGAVSIPLCTVAAVTLAALLAGRVRFSRGFQAAVFLPTLVPLVASAMVWMWLFNGEYGLINRVLAAVGIDGPTWLVDARWVLPTMVIMSLWGIGQSVVIYIAALQDVPEQLYEAARLDGLGAVRRFWHVTLPMISPVILFNVITLTINTLQVFAVPYVMFRRPDGTNPAGHYYTMYLYENAFVYGQMGYASAMAWVQLLVILALTGLMFVVSRRMVHYRGS